jgi:hypothetical protein
LKFEPSTLQNRARLADVVEQTYEETRDCPSLGNMRNIEDVLTGYRSTGVFDPTRWLIVRDADRDVGCLLLNEHPGQGHPGQEHPGPEGATPGHLELVYMGVVPAARGNGWGVHITRQAQWITRLAGLERLVLAVDAANRPALDMYSRCGFDAWDRRSVYLRFFSDESNQP